MGTESRHLRSAAAADPRRFEPWLWVAVAAGSAAALVQTLTPGIIGFFHDDAIYAGTARLLAEGDAYRLASLPEAPYQTKYPPFYSAILALAWRIRPDFPENVLLLKALNLGFAAVAALGVALLVRRQDQEIPWVVPVACQLAVITSPLVVGLANFTMAGHLFAAEAVLILVLWGRWSEPLRPRREAAVLALTAAAILTWSVGIAIGAALALDCLLRRQRGRAALHAAVTAAVFAAWTAWGAAHRVGISPLIAYYLEYEKPAFMYLAADPRLAFHIVEGNVRMAVAGTRLMAGSLWPLFWPLLVLTLTMGVWRLWRTGWRMPLLFAGCHLSLILQHPWTPHRYLLPLVPVFVMAMVAGATQVSAVISRWQAARKIPASAAMALVLSIVLFGNLLTVGYLMRPGNEVRGWTGEDTGYTWSGYQQTFDWIRRHTPPEAKIGARFDTMYFLYTGRQAVRPWFHNSQTYFYPYGAATPYVGRYEDAARELRALGVDYLVLDPPGGGEGPAAMALLRALIALPEVNGRLVFTSHDGLHQVYRLWSPGTAGAQSRTTDSLPPGN